jgi:hypothetical protein
MAIHQFYSSNTSGPWSKCHNIANTTAAPKPMLAPMPQHKCHNNTNETAAPMTHHDIALV